MARQEGLADKVAILDYRWTNEGFGRYWGVVGELRNDADVPLAVVVQAIARNREGRVVESIDFHINHGNPVPPGETWPIQIPVTLGEMNEQRSDVRVIRATP